MVTTKYSEIPDTPFEEKSEPDNNPFNIAGSHRTKSCHNSTPLLVTVQIVLLVLSFIFLAFALIVQSKNAVTRQTGDRSTIGNLANNYHPMRFDLEYIHTRYRGPPSIEVDLAWEELIENKYMIVPDKDLHGANTSSHQPLRGSNDKESGVWAMFEGFHALHCVNLLWRQTWPDYYVHDRLRLQQNPEITHIHLDHCADLLRQMIQCNMDFSVITHYRKGTKVFADYDVLHQCQDFEAALQYTKDHQWSRKYQKNFDGYAENKQAIGNEEHGVSSGH